jgi:hypothetical protein
VIPNAAIIVRLVQLRSILAQKYFEVPKVIPIYFFEPGLGHARLHEQFQTEPVALEGVLAPVPLRCPAVLYIEVFVHKHIQRAGILFFGLGPGGLVLSR